MHRIKYKCWLTVFTVGSRGPKGHGHPPPPPQICIYTLFYVLFLCLWKWLCPPPPPPQHGIFTSYTIYLFICPQFIIPKFSIGFLLLESTYTQSFYNNDTSDKKEDILMISYFKFQGFETGYEPKLRPIFF